MIKDHGIRFLRLRSLSLLVPEPVLKISLNSRSVNTEQTRTPEKSSLSDPRNENGVMNMEVRDIEVRNEELFRVLPSFPFFLNYDPEQTTCQSSRAAPE